jgi:GDP/UDP-N,N'-diacetylbacillosamine 2-epimerase (hydrolysing)
MKRRIVSITGTRADYGLMRPVFSAITQSQSLHLDLIVTGMHLLPEFQTSLADIEADQYGDLHRCSTILSEDNGKAMAQSLGRSVFNIAELLGGLKPDIMLLQGDRGEMLAGAICAAHMNIPIIHMSGGDYSGSIDDSIRNAISKFSHFHLTTCKQSTERLLAMGETSNRIHEVGEPGLDAIRQMAFIPADDLAHEFGLDLSQPLILATQHPVTTEADQAAWQIAQTLDALSDMGIQTIFTYPNTDAGGREMIRVLESFSSKSFLRIIPNLGSIKYLSLMKIASVLVGNSSSGILEAPSFKLPVVNIGTRQYGRLRASNVLEVEYDRRRIKEMIQFALQDKAFRAALATCTNPYGDGRTAEKTAAILKQLKLTPSLLTKWIPTDELFCPRGYK